MVVGWSQCAAALRTRGPKSLPGFTATETRRLCVRRTAHWSSTTTAQSTGTESKTVAVSIIATETAVRTLESISLMHATNEAIIRKPTASAVTTTRISGNDNTLN